MKIFHRLRGGVLTHQNQRRVYSQPKIYGGLAVASYGITKGLSLQGDMETIFCMPKPSGEEEKFLKIIGMNQVPIVWRDVNYDYLKSRLLEMTPEEYYSFRDHIYADFSYMHVNDLGCMEFAGIS